jgi:eukaryotic-like serine/threonine-protein kinase
MFIAIEMWAKCSTLQDAQVSILDERRLMNDSPEQAERLFETAIGLDQSHRCAFLDEACREDPTLRDRVEKLLAENALAGSFLEQPLFAHFGQQGNGRGTTALLDSRDAGVNPAPNRHPQFSSRDIILNRFVVVRFIARGGMGEVYEVEDRQLHGVHLALKTVLERFAADPLMQARFKREVLLAREVVHPNVCPIYDIFHWERPEGSLIFLTMKLLAGETLSARLDRQGPLPSSEAIHIVNQVAAGLAAAHNAGILHRDIKAANIMLEGSGDDVHACVMDFGLARVVQSETTVLTLGVAGTPGYMAPELFYGDPPSKASDVFAFGVVSYQILTGHLPKLTLKNRQEGEHEHSFDEVPAPWRPLIEGCLETSLARRYKSVPEALESLPGAKLERRPHFAAPRLLSRRQLIALGAGTVAAIAGGAWLERDDILNLLEPLPKKRSVALMAWPQGESPDLVATVLDSISQRLARAEAFVNDLLIITPKDVPSTGVSIDSPEKNEGLLGANLVLAASLRRDDPHLRLNLQLLEAHSRRVLRRGEVSCRLQEISTLAENASRVAASLLRLPSRDVSLNDPEELRKVSPDVFQVFTEAEQLVHKPNYTGLHEAILTYQHALELNDRFALCYAKLAMAYIYRFSLTHEPANIDLAGKNAESSLRYNPSSAMGLLAKAVALLSSGRFADADIFFAKALNADPGNPNVLFYKAWALENQEKLGGAAQTYRDTLARRPNYWPAYNNLGVIFARQANYKEAAKQFAAAGMAAPEASLPMANLGQTYIQLGRHDDARTALSESISRGSNSDTYLLLGDLDFEDGKYTDALSAYTSAGKMDPKNHVIERNKGDCYAMSGDSIKMRECYQRAARLLSSALSVNPQYGFGWANLAFYHAKLGDVADAQSDMKNADAHRANDVASRFMIVQALALLGRKKEALNLLIWCVDQGLSKDDVDLALDLKDLRKDPAYLSHLNKRTLSNNASKG